MALLRNDVQLKVDFYAPLKGTLSDNKMIPLATGGLRRTSYLPDVPAVAETVPGYEATAWNGIFARVGTPPEILNVLKLLARRLDLLLGPRKLHIFHQTGHHERARCQSNRHDHRGHFLSNSHDHLQFIPSCLL